MPLSLPAELVLEKNKLYSSGAFIELLEIQMQSGQTMRIANNNENISWGGYSWSRFRFEGGDQSEGDDGESKSVTVRVSNLAGTVQSEVDGVSNYLIGDAAIYRLVHADYPDKAPAIIGYFDIMEVAADDEWMVFELGVENFYLNAFPRNSYRRNVCRYQPHQTDVCGYAASNSCDRSFSACITLGMTSVFGGQPGIPGGVWNV